MLSAGGSAPSPAAGPEAFPRRTDWSITMSGINVPAVRVRRERVKLPTSSESIFNELGYYMISFLIHTDLIYCSIGDRYNHHISSLLTK